MTWSSRPKDGILGRDARLSHTKIGAREKFDTEEEWALYQFSEAANEDKGWTLERGYSPYVQEWLDYYLRLKNERLACGGPSSKQEP